MFESSVDSFSNTFVARLAALRSDDSGDQRTPKKRDRSRILVAISITEDQLIRSSESSAGRKGNEATRGKGTIAGCSTTAL